MLEISRDILKREIVIDQASSKVIGVFSFIILTALGAYVRFPLPFTPVPITLQTFFVLLSGAVLGRKYGPVSQLGYLSLGLLGVPVFSAVNQVGWAYLLGPTGGYIFGFALASWITAEMIQGREQNNFTQIVLAMIVASLAGIYLLGILGLSLFLHCNLLTALKLGFFPFLVGDIVKIIAAALVFGKIEKRCQQLFS